MKALTECPKVGDEVYGRLLAFKKDGTTKSKMGIAIVDSVGESANEGLINVFFHEESANDDKEWGGHSYWSIARNEFEYADDVLTGLTAAENTLRWKYALAKSELKIANVLRKGQSEAMSKLNTARATWKRALSGKPPLEHYPDADFYTTMAGMPCGIVVTHYAPERCNNWGHPDDRLPDDPEEVEFIVVDRKGYEADWLRAKVSGAKLESHVLDLVHGRPVRVGVY